MESGKRKTFLGRLKSLRRRGIISLTNEGASPQQKIAYERAIFVRSKEASPQQKL